MIWFMVTHTVDARKTFTRYEIGLQILWRTRCFNSCYFASEIDYTTHHPSIISYYIFIISYYHFAFPYYELVPELISERKDTSSHWSRWNGYLELIWMNYFRYHFCFSNILCPGIMIAEPLSLNVTETPCVLRQLWYIERRRSRHPQHSCES